MNNNILRKILGLLLSDLTGTTSVIATSLIDACPNCADDLELINYLNDSRKLKATVTTEHLAKAYESLSLHQNSGIEVIPYGSADYPLSLRLINKPPTVLYYRGNLDLLSNLPGVAVVGSRQITSNGSEITRRITNMLVENNLIIVSGLAIGVDSAAHRATIQAKGQTIAVLANGLDKALPKQNERLGAEILEAGGAWVSEYPIGVKPMKHFFVQRNRIQVGLSAGSVIIEATLNSGTMTQAEFCNRNHRPLFAVVPHKPENPLGLECEGTSELVNSNRAIPLMSKNDYENLITTVLSNREALGTQKGQELLI
ncbi:DNA-protecting protein DprA [Vibrio lentus]|uniref:DNA-processing protein DprA n=1 Tax=Vibrio lentus TaxID=136468 RepID=UPI0010BDBD1E|nr:DNA-processing protein DprA [Vibrio lentus]TKF94992.1 DNA-protecting protein DprA [Vibrio lentus]